MKKRQSASVGLRAMAFVDAKRHLIEKAGIGDWEDEWKYSHVEKWLMKNTRFLFVILMISLSISCTRPSAVSEETGIICTREVFFSPHGGCTEAIVNEVSKAKTSVLVQAYSFNSAPIAKALVNAHERGVKVQIVLDKGQMTQEYPEADFFANAGIPSKIDALHFIAYNNVMIIDEETVIMGSFNAKAAEESNAGKLLILHDKKLASLYVKNWQDHAQHSEPYAGRGQ
jgi:phosphatidylserine/phosphatidylglycerophosphate/cardiolipin synthase-like enzyme